MKDKKIGFIGQGWVGKNFADDFENRGHKIVRYSLEESYINNKDKLRDCTIIFIAVPTPTTPQGFDDSILRKAIKEVEEGKVVVIKSTVMPGMTESIQEENPGIIVMHSPEFLTEANVKHDVANPKRNIIGITKMTDELKDQAQTVLKTLPNAPVNIICSTREAEIAKYGSNCFLATKVLFMNLLFDLSLEYKCDWDVIKKGISADSRIGDSHMNLVHDGGRGFGGHCFPKDFVVLRDSYKKSVGDEKGIKVFNSIMEKNLDLLKKSGKDLDIIKEIYGDI